MKQFLFSLLLILFITSCALAATSYRELTSPFNTELLGLDVIDSNNLWVVGTQSAVAKSSDGGQTWTINALAGITSEATTVYTFRSILFIDDGKTGFLVGHNRSNNKGFVYKTVDGGNNWALSGSELALGDFYDIRFFGDTGFVAGKRGMFTTTNAGGNWAGVTGTGSKNWRRIFGTGSTYWLVGEGSNVLKSSNSGSTWAAPSTTPSYSAIYNSVFSLGDYHAWITGNTNDNTASTSGVLVTHDGGTTWTETTTASLANLKYRDFRLTVSKSGGVIEVNGAYLCGRNGSSQANIWAWDGTDWASAYSSTTTNTLNRMDSSDTDNIWFVGGNASASSLIVKRVADPTIEAVVQGVPRTSQSSIPQGFDGYLLVSGGYFISSPQVAISGTGITIASTTLVNPRLIRLKVTAASDATISGRTVTVTNWDGGIGTKEAAFSVTQGPTITSITPAILNPGHLRTTSNPVTVEGSGFSSDLIKANITFGDGIAIRGCSVLSSSKVEVYLFVQADASAGTRTVTITNPDGGTASKANGCEIISDAAGLQMSSIKLNGTLYFLTVNSEDIPMLVPNKPTLTFSVADGSGIDPYNFKLFIIPKGSSTADINSTITEDIPAAEFTDRTTTTTAGGREIITGGKITHTLSTTLSTGPSRVILYAQNAAGNPRLDTVFIRVPTTSQVISIRRNRIAPNYRNGRYWKPGDGDLPFDVDNDGGTAGEVEIVVPNMDGSRTIIKRTMQVGRNRFLFPRARLDEMPVGVRPMLIKFGNQVVDSGKLTKFNR